MKPKVIINGVEYIPKEEKSPTQGKTDEQLINQAAWDYYEKHDPERKNYEPVF